MNYTTLQYNGTEKALADWGVSAWSRPVQNQADDSFTFTIPTPMDGSDMFPYGAQIIVRINRSTTTVNAVNPTLPQSGATSFSGGTQWFVGYCVDNDRVGEPGAESFNYKFVGPYQFFFERLIFQKLQLTWNGVKQIADYQSDIVLGLSLTVLTGTGDTVLGSTATNLMSIRQQIIEIVAYAQADSAYQQSTNGLGWAGTNQFTFDANTADSNGNYFLLSTEVGSSSYPSGVTCKIPDYAYGAASGLTSANTTGQMLRCPLDAVNAITCAEAMRRQLQWIGGIGSPVVWTDHSQTPPVLHVVTRDQLAAQSLALTGITVKNKIKKRSDLIPAAVHFKYKVAGTYLGQPYSVVINDVAAYIGGTLVEGIGQLGALTNPGSGAALSSGNQTALMAAAKTATAIVQTFDFQGDQVSAATCSITTAAMNLSNPSGGGDGGFWATVFPELKNFSGVTFAVNNTPAAILPTIVDYITPTTVYYTSGAWSGGVTYGNRVTDGQVAPWMLTGGESPVAGQTVKAVIKACFSYTETATGKKISYREFNKEVTISTLGSGTYTSNASVAYGEPIPYGLAGYILGIESVPQYEGSITVQETEISDVCPIGNALNITGGLTEWATMNACIQSVRYNDNGQTEISFGPAKHLGPAQFVARFRTNVGPRWYNFINSDPMNTQSNGSTTLGSNIPASCTGDGASNATFHSFLNNQGAYAAGTGTAFPPGVHVDAGTVASPFSGFPQGAAVVVAGSGGTTSASYIRISIGDFNGHTIQMWAQELPVCVTVSGVPTAMYQMFLCSPPYATSIG